MKIGLHKQSLFFVSLFSSRKSWFLLELGFAAFGQESLNMCLSGEEESDEDDETTGVLREVKLLQKVRNRSKGVSAMPVYSRDEEEKAEGEEAEDPSGLLDKQFTSTGLAAQMQPDKHL